MTIAIGMFADGGGMQEPVAFAMVVWSVAQFVPDSTARILTDTQF